MEKPTLWSEGEGRRMRARITEVARIDSRGSKDGMLWKIHCPVLETRCAAWGDHQRLRIRKRKRSRVQRESEGFIVPFEIEGQQTALTGRELTPIKLEKIVGNVNRSLNGWVNYFRYRNTNLVMEKVKTHAEQRLRKHLMKRHKVKDRGIGEGRFPSVNLYGRYGLYKVPTAAGWRSAHASV
jgi:hypothetical protein